MAKSLSASRFDADRSASTSNLTADLANARPVSRLARVVAAALQAWQRRRRARVALSRLDAHLLRDIGLSAQDAGAEVEKPFWRA